MAFINRNDKVGEAKVYQAKREFDLEKENEKLRKALSCYKEACEYYLLNGNALDYGQEASEAILKASRILEEE